MDAIASGDIQVRDRGFKRPVIYTPPKTGGSGGAGGRIADLGDESGQLAKLSKQMNDRIFKIGQENDALQLLATGQASNKESAKLMAAAMALNGGQMDSASLSTVKLYDAQVRLQKELEKNAANSLKDYIESLPTAINTTRQASADTAKALQDGIAGTMTGDFDAKGIVDSLRRSLANKLAGVLTGKLLGKFTAPSGVQAGAQIGAQTMSMGILTGSAQGARMFAATIAGAAIPSAGTTPGGGGWLSTALSFLGGLFSEGGYSDAPAMSNARMSAAMFHNAPHFREGTANTSGGRPAMLHPNEAVIPLSKGRKIGVDLKGGGGGDNITQFSGGIHTQVTIDGAGGDLSDPTKAAAIAENIAVIVNLKVRESMADAARYGGMMNPRGGR